MADDDLSAELDRIAERHQIVAAADLNPSAFGGNPYAALVKLADDDAPRLLAALRAVLELADDAGLMSIDAAGAACAWDLDPAKVRESITREITGKGESDASH